MKLKLKLVILFMLICVADVGAARRDKQQDCFALARAYVASCVAEGTNDGICTQRANAVYNDCMDGSAKQGSTK